MCAFSSAEYALVGEVEVVPRDLVAEDRRPLEGAQALGGDHLVVLVDVVQARLEDGVRAATPPRARSAARGCPGGGRGTCAPRSRGRSGSPRGCRARRSPRAPRGRACRARSPRAATSSRSRTRRSGRRRPSSTSRAIVPPQPNSPSSVCGARTSTRCQDSITSSPSPSARTAPAPATRAGSGGGAAAARTARSARAGPRTSDPRRARCRRGCARRSRRRAAAIARQARPLNADAGPAQGDEERRRRRASRAAAARGCPVSAATVTAVLCDAAFFGSLPLQADAVGVRALEAADADALDRVVRGDPDPLRDQLRAAARRLVQARARLAQQRVADVRRPERDGGDHAPRRPRARRAARQRQRNAGDDGGADHQRREARLREREEQAGPDQRRSRRPTAYATRRSRS